MSSLKYSSKLVWFSRASVRSVTCMIPSTSRVVWGFTTPANMHRSFDSHIQVNCILRHHQMNYKDSLPCPPSLMWTALHTAVSIWWEYYVHGHHWRSCQIAAFEPTFSCTKSTVWHHPGYCQKPISTGFFYNELIIVAQVDACQTRLYCDCRIQFVNNL